MVFVGFWLDHLFDLKQVVDHTISCVIMNRYSAFNPMDLRCSF